MTTVLTSIPWVVGCIGVGWVLASTYAHNKEPGDFGE